MLTTHLQHFWMMGGYAQYVWPVYFLAAGILIGNTWSTRRRMQQTKRKIKHWLERTA